MPETLIILPKAVVVQDLFDFCLDGLNDKLPQLASARAVALRSFLYCLPDAPHGHVEVFRPAFGYRPLNEPNQ